MPIKQRFYFFFTNCANSDQQISFKGKVIKPALACRSLGIQFFSILTFENHFIRVLGKMVNAIPSLYLVRSQIPLKVRIDVFKSDVLSHLSFSGVFLQTVTVKRLNYINRQINWGIKVSFFVKNLTTPLTFSLRIVSSQPNCLSQNLA